MRNSDGGLLPASNHATSSSRDCSGVISIWSRAMRKSGYLAIRPNAPCGKGNADGGVRINETYGGRHRAGTPSRAAAALTSEQEQPAKLHGVGIRQLGADMLFDRRRIGVPHLLLQLASGLGDLDELAALVDL